MQFSSVGWRLWSRRMMPRSRNAVKTRAASTNLTRRKFEALGYTASTPSRSSSATSSSHLRITHWAARLCMRLTLSGESACAAMSAQGTGIG